MSMINFRTTTLSIKNFFNIIVKHFFICFEILLLVSFGLLLKHDQQTAEKVANYAFYSLVLGVLINLLNYLYSSDDK